jgi:hypothetical protein
LHKLKLIDTSAEHLFAVLEHQKAGNSTHHYLRRLHNFALNLGWLLAPVMAEAACLPFTARSFARSRKTPHREGNQSGTPFVLPDALGNGRLPIGHCASQLGRQRFLRRR